MQQLPRNTYEHQNAWFESDLGQYFLSREQAMYDDGGGRYFWL